LRIRVWIFPRRRGACKGSRGRDSGRRFNAAVGRLCPASGALHFDFYILLFWLRFARPRCHGMPSARCAILAFSAISSGTIIRAIPHPSFPASPALLVLRSDLVVGDPALDSIFRYNDQQLRCAAFGIERTSSPRDVFRLLDGIPVLFFSLSQSKLPGYVLPAVPPLFILLGYGVTRSMQGDAKPALRALGGREFSFCRSRSLYRSKLQGVRWIYSARIRSGRARRFRLRPRHGTICNDEAPKGGIRAGRAPDNVDVEIANFKNSAAIEQAHLLSLAGVGTFECQC